MDLFMCIFRYLLHVCACISAYIHTYVNIRKCIYTHIYECTYIYVYMYIYIHFHVGWKKKRDLNAVDAAARMNPKATYEANVGFGDNRGE
jgi:magnesium-transporting ATPase (P-type)